ncbi:MAG: hypothetical protein A2V70_00490 [Planctomycetes bacterium RBG_13_63_9]|nr:MAG: hypothetical protein A2V70_00490 [Planctomycetes bacterium RBG_13_63_9]
MISSRHPTATTDPAAAGLQPAGDGRMWYDRRFRPSLWRSGLTGFDAVMGSASGRCLRVLKDRENWHLKLSDPPQQAHGAYLKKHHVRTWRSRLGAMLGIRQAETAGRIEAQNVRALKAAGIEVMDLMAYGERIHADGLLESFVLTEELQQFEPLEQFLRGQFGPSPSHLCMRHDRDRDRDRLIRRLARIVRRFHAAGYNHRDLYCCHFFIKEPVPGEFQIKLIDLQRVQLRRRFRRRWLVKDLAQLAWSVPRNRVRCTQRLAFMRHYLGVPKLRPADKRLIRKVLAKQRLMQRKLGVAE